MTKKIISFLLCLVMVLSLVACDRGSESTEPQNSVPSTTPATEPPAPTPEEAYLSAVEALKANNAMELTFTYTLTRQVSAMSLTETCEEHILYQNYGSDDLFAQITDVTSFGKESVKSVLTYSGGREFNEVGGGQFTTEMDAAEFLDNQYPLDLLNPEYYESVELSGDTILFTQPLQVEDWLGGSDVVTQAQGTVTLDGSGCLRSIVYTAEYDLCGIPCEFSGELTAKQASYLTIPSIPPKYSEDWIGMEDAGDATLLFLSLAAQSQTNLMTASGNTLLVVQAGALGTECRSTISMMEDRQELRMQESQSIYQMGESTELETDISYIDGVVSVTSTVNGDENTQSNEASFSNVESLCSEAYTPFTLDPADLRGMECDYVGGLYLFTFDYNEDWAKEQEYDLCQTLFGNKKILEQLTADYRTETTEGYLSVNPLTMLPVAYGMDLEVYHTIEGDEYMTRRQEDWSHYHSYTEIYDDIHEELPEAVEPQQKAQPLLYHVTDGEGHELWLLGTIHIGDDRTAFLPQALYDALDASDALALEVDTDQFDVLIEEDPEFLEMVRDCYFYQDDTTLKDHLDEDVYEDALKVLKASGNYNYNTEYYKPEILGQMISQSFVTLGNVHTYSRGVEDQLTERARENEMEILSIESYRMHVSLFADFGDEMQQFYLESCLEDTLGGCILGEIDLFDRWCSGDEEEIIAEFKEDEKYDFENMTDQELTEYLLTEEEYEEVTEEDLADFKEEIRLYGIYNQAMIIDRNDGMLEAAIGYLLSGKTVFYAVGQAHLFSYNGLVEGLRDAGYTVELVQYG